MNFRILAYFFIFLITACATNQTTKHGQKKGKWMYYKADGQMEREEFYKPVKQHIDKATAFQLGWPANKYKDSLIYGEELIHIKRYHYNKDGELQRIERIDTSYLFLDLFQKVPATEPKK